jgi:hypothetical protein
MQFSVPHDVQVKRVILTSALDGSGRSTPRPVVLPSGKETQHPLYWRLCGPQNRSGWVWIKESSLRPQGFEPRTASSSTDICTSHIQMFGYKAIELRISDALIHNILLCVLSAATHVKSKLGLHTPWRAPHTRRIGPGWARKPVWTFRRRYRCLAPAGFRTRDRPAPSLVFILSRFPHQRKRVSCKCSTL